MELLTAIFISGNGEIYLEQCLFWDNNCPDFTQSKYTSQKKPSDVDLGLVLSPKRNGKFQQVEFEETYNSLDLFESRSRSAVCTRSKKCKMCRSCWPHFVQDSAWSQYCIHVRYILRSSGLQVCFRVAKRPSTSQPVSQSIQRQVSCKTWVDWPGGHNLLRSAHCPCAFSLSVSVSVSLSLSLSVCLSVCLSLSLSLFLTHTHTRRRARALTHTKQSRRQSKNQTRARQQANS